MGMVGTMASMTPSQIFSGSEVAMARHASANRSIPTSRLSPRSHQEDPGSDSQSLVIDRSVLKAGSNCCEQEGG